MRLVLIVLLSLFLACANQGMPPGGPEDKTPPEIIESFPEQGALNVPSDRRVEVRFSEGIDPRSVEEAVFITPFQGENVKIKAAGSRIRIVFKKPFRPNRTHVITFGTGIRDYRGNALASSYVLAFSTGNRLDTGEISGQVLGQTDASGVGVWAYDISDSLNIDPRLTHPDYIVQCAKNGDFHFTNLAWGPYRLMAVSDRLADRLYQPGEDALGVASQDIFLSDSLSRSADHFLKMSVADTAGPSLVQAAPMASTRILAAFDEPVVSSVQDALPVYITAEYDSTDTLRVLHAFSVAWQPEQMIIVTDSLQDSTAYRVTAHRVQDHAGNDIDTLFNTASFVYQSQPDTVSPRLLLTFPEHRARHVHTDHPFFLRFNEPVDTLHFDEGFQLTDTTRTPVSTHGFWIQEQMYQFTPSHPLEDLTWYQISLHNSLIRDKTGNALPDTVLTFQSLNKDTLASISGQIQTAGIDSSLQFIIMARQMADPSIEYQLNCQAPYQYQLPDILPGHYVLEFFLDKNRDGKYDYGSIIPYCPSEPVMMYQDTVKVRSRWPNEGNDIQFHR